MFPYYKGPEESKDLDYDDIMALYELYSKYFLLNLQFVGEIDAKNSF